MRKTNIKITIFLAIFVLAGQYSAFLAYASEINSKNVIGLVNDERSKNGLKPLVESAELSRAAYDKAQDMLKKDYFSHTSPEGKTPWFWFEKEGYDYKFAGENLAINYSSAEKQNEAWMKSETHRKNILNPNFSEIGVAVVKGKVDGEEALITVQEFGHRVQPPAIKGESLESRKELAKQVQGISGEKALIEAPIERQRESEGQETVEKNQLKNVTQPEGFSGLQAVDYLRLMKGSVAISLFVSFFFVFSFFAHNLSKLKSIIAKLENSLFAHKIPLSYFDDCEYRIILRTVPASTKKAGIIHLEHMKQRE